MALVVGGFGLAIALVVLGAALASQPAPKPASIAAGSPGSPRPVNVIMRDYRFDPTPLYVVPGETLRLNVVNGGLLEHELVLGDARVQQAWARAHAVATPPAGFATAPPASVPPGTGGLRLLLPSGGTTVADYAVPAEGTVQLVCHLPGHAERGMVGRVEFIVP